MRFLKWLRIGARVSVRVLLIALAILVVVVWFSSDHLRSFGGAPSGARLARMRASSRFEGEHFVNHEPTGVMKPGRAKASFSEWFFGKQMRVPSCPLPIVHDTAARLAKAPSSSLRITWLGHSTTLIELDGVTLLTDPMWSERASPLPWIGPKRFDPPALAISALPHLDAVLISHEHYDHLDMASVRALATRGVTFHGPLGIGAHLTTWGVPERQIVEHDEWQAASLPHGVTLTSTPSRHFNGRGVPGRIGALWTSWAITGPTQHVFFSGDTGFTSAFSEIKRRFGPFDVAMLEIGQYHPSWGDIHLGPRGALDAHAALGAKVLFPIHWGAYSLAYHAWSEPVETLVTLATQRGVHVQTPHLGEPVEPSVAAADASERWWRALPPMAASCP